MTGGAWFPSLLPTASEDSSETGVSTPCPRFPLCVLTGVRRGGEGREGWFSKAFKSALAPAGAGEEGRGGCEKGAEYASVPRAAPVGAGGGERVKAVEHGRSSVGKGKGVLTGGDGEVDAGRGRSGGGGLDAGLRPASARE